MNIHVRMMDGKANFKRHDKLEISTDNLRGNFDLCTAKAYMCRVSDNRKRKCDTYTQEQILLRNLKMFAGIHVLHYLLVN